ncbi:MAG: tripartite tricarboxylate transporter TctB family protein [Thermodesulfobacteriota bacterium]
MKKLQLLSGLIIMAFAALVCFDSSKLTFGTPGRPGPGFFPLGLGSLLLLLSLIFVFKTAFKWNGISDSARTLWAGLRWKQIPYTLAALLGYALVLNRVGYLICTWILMTYLFWGKGTKRKGFAIIGAVIVSVISYVIFRGFLKVRLPLGLLRL